MINRTIRLQLGEERVKALKEYNLKVLRHLEKKLPLSLAVLEDLKNALSEVVQGSSEWAEVLRGIRESGEYYCVHLLHPDNEILNLPWSMAEDSISGQALGSIRQLYLTKSITGLYKEAVSDFTAAAPPLKVLIMISMPEDIKEEQRLSYEEEEYAILEAFEPLLRAGLVEIDFTEDGSLEALERKLTSNRFHVLHFFGHGIYDEDKQKGFLQLEEPESLHTELAEDKDFADVVNCNPDYRVPMVVLASCQTAKGGSEKALSGVTNHLLRIGVPVVVSMGMSIFDHYAAIFSACFYRKIAERQTIFTAYNAALDKMREAEHDDLVKARVSPAVPLQWIIPNLYLSSQVERVVDWNRPVEKLELTSNRYIFEKGSMLLRHEEEYLFIGRRREKAEILRPFFDKVPVMLNGQGGVGKTAMAEHLVQRLIARNPKTVPFIFNEKTRAIDDIIETLKNYLREEGKIKVILEVDKIEKGLDKFLFLAFEIAENRNPVFVFDNLESFQTKPGEEISDEYGDLREIIDFLCTSRKFHLVLTGRYKVPGFKGLQNFDLNQVGLNDFWKRCIYMDVGYIYIYLREAASFKKLLRFHAKTDIRFIDIVKLLHQTFGGNYRALEFFDRLAKENPNIIENSLDSLEKFQENSKEIANEVKKQMGQNLLFSQLMVMLDREQRQVLDLLSHFRVPVQVMALELQRKESKQEKAVDWPGVLDYLNRLTLIEISIMSEIKTVFYYVTPLVRDLLDSLEKAGDSWLFSHEQAGRYYYSSFYNIDDSLTALEEAFYHFDLSGNRERVQEIGDWLSNFYYEYCIYRSAFYYASRVYELWGDETEGHIINRLGLIYRLYGEYEPALNFLLKALDGFRELGNKEGEGTSLNNIGEIYRDRDDYETALHNLEQSLKIRREIGDKAGEGTTLNNISLIYSARGDYDTALHYLEQCLKIFQEIEDKKNEGTTLNNIGEIYRYRGDYENSLHYLEQSLKIRREIGDKAGEGTTLNNISLIYSARGDYDTALHYLEQCLKIFQEIEDKKNEGTTLNNISQIYKARGDYDTALHYLEQSLKISREIGAKVGEGTTLGNMGNISYAQGDFDAAIKYMEKGLKIFQEIGDKSKEGAALNNISQIYSTRGDHEKALRYLEQSLKISREIGDRAGEGTTLNNISGICRDRGDYETALNYLEQCLKIFQEIGDKKNEGTTLNNMATTAYARGDYEKALHYLEQSLKISREIGDKAGQGTTLNNMATTAHARGDYETALSYLEQSLKIHQEIGNKAGQGTTLNNISQIYKARGDNDTALSYLEQSLKIRREIGDKGGQGTTLNNISQIYSARGDYETALSYLKQSLKIRREIGDKSGSISTLHNIALIAHNKGDIEKFLEYETAAYKIAIEINHAMGIYHVGRQLGYVLRQSGVKEFKDQGIEMLKRSLAIGKAAGFPDVGQVEEMLKSVGS